MIRPIDPQVLEAIVNDDKDDCCPRVKSAKWFVNEDRNLSSGLRSLLQSYPDFYSELWQHEIPIDTDKKGATSWHIAFRVRAPFLPIARKTKGCSRTRHSTTFSFIPHLSKVSSMSM